MTMRASMAMCYREKTLNASQLHLGAASKKASAGVAKQYVTQYLNPLRVR
jgi:hypothetical protein